MYFYFLTVYEYLDRSCSSFKNSFLNCYQQYKVSCTKYFSVSYKLLKSFNENLVKFGMWDSWIFFFFTFLYSVSSLWILSSEVVKLKTVHVIYFFLQFNSCTGDMCPFATPFTWKILIIIFFCILPEFLCIH